MVKRITVAVVLVFVVWWTSGFLIHGVLLRDAYADTPSLWRTEQDMQAKLPWLWLGIAVTATAFTLIYALLVDRRNVPRGALFGLLYGVAAGVSMGLGSYCSMPIPAAMALTWGIGTLVEMVVAGIIVGVIVTKPAKIQGETSSA